MKFFFLAVFAYYIDTSQQWSYDDESSWPEICRKGKRQSPINIDTSKAVQFSPAPLEFRRYTRVETQGNNNGHTVETFGPWSPDVKLFLKRLGAMLVSTTVQFYTEGDVDERPVISGGPLEGAYVLDQLHFHWVSEHAIDHQKHNLEMHFVHHRRDMTLEEAFNEKDGLVVVGVFGRVTSDPEDDWALQQIMDYVSELTDIKSVTLTRPLDMLRLMSPDRDSYYKYEGSLTTPRCNETVTWLVMDKPISITDDQYKLFNKVSLESKTNFRSLQKLNHRTVYRTPKTPSSSAVTTQRPHPIITGIFTTMSGLMAIAHGTVACLAGIVKKTVEKVIKIKKEVLNHVGIYDYYFNDYKL